MLLEGRCALVTGGAQGIGAGIARVLAEQGARVSIVDLQSEKAAETAAEIDAQSITADIATAEGCAAAVTETVDVLGGLDLLVNNAAPGRNRDLLGQIAGPDWPAHADMVLAAVARLSEAAEPHLGPGASIVNISSMTAQSVAPEHCSWPYHVSKAGLDHLTRWLACQLGPKGIRVNAVAPALVDRDRGPKLTDNIDAKRIIGQIVPLGRAGKARDVGNAVAFLASDMASYITGQVLTLDGGLGVREVFGAAMRSQA